MNKVLNTTTKKFLAFKQFVLNRIDNSCGIYMKSKVRIEDGWLFKIDIRGSSSPVFVKLGFNTYQQHKGDWNMNAIISSNSTHLGNGFYGHEIIPCDIGVALLENI